MELNVGRTIPQEIDTTQIEAYCRKLWESSGIYRFNTENTGEVFSVDTPPPYVSASHLHVGHAMSYAQAEFIVRYQRMNGRNIFYPMGFDDNGLPTERYVEKAHKINKQRTTRRAFRELCLDVTKEGGQEYEKLWRALGLSVDWKLRYSTIDDHCRRTAQKSFIELYRSGRIYRSNEPVLWDTSLETALAQADLESIERKSELHTIAFMGKKEDELLISTTRPELLSACVALYYNEHDGRYHGLVGTTVTVPVFGHEVPVLADDEVDPNFGTGLMMVCTFGDGEDVKRWKRDRLDTRICVGADGKLTSNAGSYESLSVEQARPRIVQALQLANSYRGAMSINQVVSVSERSGTPVEFVMASQWFIRILDLKAELLSRSAEIRWHPEWMRVRLEDWIAGLKYDWNISRQRFYGVPIPAWFCVGCGEVILPDESRLPSDPQDDPCPVSHCPVCESGDLRAESDVMDTWMTSSLTPLINSNWAGTPSRVGAEGIYPMGVRVQAFEIIRTWLFYSVVKSHLHTKSLPWRDVMISGWGLNESGKKISKRDLDEFTTPDGYNRYEPYAVIAKFGADALRYWAAGGTLGHDLRYNEKDVQVGRKLVVKLWNAARFCTMQLGDYDPANDSVPFDRRTPEDKWMLVELNRLIPLTDEAFQNYAYHKAREVTDRFFWGVFCDDYLEMIKDRFWNVGDYSQEARASARTTLWEGLRTILALYAPFLPFVTEYLFQSIYRAHEASISLHVSAWPSYNPERSVLVPEMNVVTSLLRTVRGLRAAHKIGANRRLATVTLDVGSATPEVAAAVRSLHTSIRAAVRTVELNYGCAKNDTEMNGVRVDIVA